MTKQQRKTQQQDGMPTGRTPYPGAPRGSNQGMALATLGGVVLLLMISFANWREIDSIEERLDGQLGQIENRITEIAAKVDRPAAQPARRGPDPDRVYPIKTNGAPAKGPADAPVTIAEFSDFQ